MCFQAQHLPATGDALMQTNCLLRVCHFEVLPVYLHTILSLLHLKGHQKDVRATHCEDRGPGETHSQYRDVTCSLGVGHVTAYVLVQTSGVQPKGSAMTSASQEQARHSC